MYVRCSRGRKGGPQTEAVSVKNLLAHRKAVAQRIRGVSGGPDKLKWNFQCNNCN